MKIKVDDQEIDLDLINTPEDVKKMVEEIKPSSTILYDSEEHGEVVVNEKYTSFDIMTDKEKGLVNLLLEIAKTKNNLYDQIFPLKNRILSYISSVTKENIKFDINTEQWSQFNKLTYLYQYVKVHIDITLYARLGYELFLVYEPDGKISAIKDLRDIPTEASIV